MNEIDESFSYTTLFMLKLNLLFGNKRSLTLIEALEGRRVIEMDLRKEFFCFTEIDEEEEFMNFLSECSELVYYKDGVIYLNDDITEHDIDIKIGMIKPLKYIDYTVNIFKYLKILKPIDGLYKYYDFESKIEDLYMNNKDGKNNYVIYKLFKERDCMLKDIYYGDENYQDMITMLNDELFEDLEDRYVVYPINLSRYEKSDHYDDNTNLASFLSSPMQNAIFTNYPLFRNKVKYDLNGVIDNTTEDMIKDVSDYGKKFENLDATEEYYDATIDNSELNDETNYETKMIQDEFEDGLGGVYNLTKKNILFSLCYIKELEMLKDKFKDYINHIDDIILRLKYLNDNKDLKLYEKSCYELDFLIDKLKSNDDGDYLLYADEVMYFINEIFNMNYDRYFIEKIVFIKTYYYLTYDNEIIEYINSFKYSKLYNYVYKIIVGDDKNKVKKK